MTRLLARLAKAVRRAPVGWAVAGSLALHAAALAAMHYGWQAEPAAPIAPRTFAVVTVDAPAPRRNEAPPAQSAAPIPEDRPKPTPKPAAPPAAHSTRSEAAPPKPRAADPRVDPPPAFAAPPRKPDPPREAKAESPAAVSQPAGAQEAASAPEAQPQSAARAPVEPPGYGDPGLANPHPRYPWLSRQKGEEGRVLLRVAVDPAGNAAEVEIARSSGHPRLDRAARSALARWRFTPARQGGRAVAGVIEVPVTFRLDGGN